MALMIAMTPEIPRPRPKPSFAAVLGSIGDSPEEAEEPGIIGTNPAAYVELGSEEVLVPAVEIIGAWL